MNGPAGRHALDRFRTVIVDRIGLQFDGARLDFLSNVLQRRLDHLGLPRDAYLNNLEQRLSSSEVNALACELTVCETYFFRNGEQFRVLAEVALPERMCANKAQGRLRLLSAGCASGEEAYSIAIVARETVVDPTWDVLIRAIDINPIA